MDRICTTPSPAEAVRPGGQPRWIMTALGMLWLSVFPFWQDGTGYTHITHGKWVGMLLLTGVTVACTLWALVWRLMQGRRLRFGWLQAAGLAYFGLVALSALLGSWADHTGEGGKLTVIWGASRYEGLVTQMCYAAIFLCMSTERIRLQPLLHALSAGLLLYGGVVALQYAGINALGLFPAGTSVRTNYEFQGTIGNIDMVVGYVAIAMAAALGGFARPGRSVRLQWLWLAAGLTGSLMLLCMEVQCGLIMLAALLFLLALMALRLPESRWRVLLILAGVLAMVSVRLLVTLPWLDGTDELALRPEAWRMAPLAAGILLAAAALALRSRPGPAAPAWLVAVIGALLIAGVLAALYWLPLPTGNGLWELQEILHGRMQDSFGSERIGIWRLTLEMCRDDMLWGTGPGAFLHAMDHHLWQTGQSLVQRFDNPHNLFLGVLASSGLPALALYAVMTLGGAGHGLFRSQKDEALTPMTLAVLCYLAQGMFTFSICLVTPMFWAALGMLAGQLNEREI